MDYPKLISEKWNLTAKFNCLDMPLLSVPFALRVPMCAHDEGVPPASAQLKRVLFTLALHRDYRRKNQTRECMCVCDKRQ